MTPTPHQPDSSIDNCPFCASSAEVMRYGNDNGGASYSVLCSGCGIGTAWCHGGTEQEAKERAIAAWNRRAEAAAGAVPEGLRRESKVLAKMVERMDYTESYFGEPVGWLKATAHRLTCMIAAMPSTPPAAAPSEPVAMMTCGKCGKDRLTEGCQRLDCEFVGTALATPPAQDAGTGELIPCAYRIGPIELRGVKIEEAGQMEGPALWAVRRSGSCLNKSGEWEYEPLPSSRDDAFLARCRFTTPTEAFRAIANSGRTE